MVSPSAVFSEISTHNDCVVEISWDDSALFVSPVTSGISRIAKLNCKMNMHILLSSEYNDVRLSVFFNILKIFKICRLFKLTLYDNQKDVLWP
jgi:hypothetical protein